VGLATRTYNPGVSPGAGRYAYGRYGYGRFGRDHFRRPFFAAAVIGGGAYPYWGDEYPYDYVGYGYPVSYGIGNYCAAPARTCLLLQPADVGAPCSCRVPGGRTFGEVVP